MKNLPKIIVCLLIGFIIGAAVTDSINSNNYKDDLNLKLHDSYDFGTLIFAYSERVDTCPKCGYKFNYLFNYDKNELQELIDNYLGSRSFYQ